MVGHEPNLQMYSFFTFWTPNNQWGQNKTKKLMFFVHPEGRGLDVIYFSFFFCLPATGHTWSPALSASTADPACLGVTWPGCLAISQGHPPAASPQAEASQLRCCGLLSQVRGLFLHNEQILCSFSKVGQNVRNPGKIVPLEGPLGNQTVPREQSESQDAPHIFVPQLVKVST